MKKILSIIFVLMLGSMLWAQEDGEQLDDGRAYSFYPPNYEKIEKESHEVKSPHYFPTLAKRFAKADTTLELDDLIAFYYGHIFQPGYNPYTQYDQFDEIRNIMRTEASKKSCQQIVKLADEVIKINPTELQSYNYKFMALATMCDKFGGDTILMEKTRMQFLQLYYTLMATGNGLSPEVAIHVTNTAHEYLVMNLNDFSPRSQSLQFIDGHAYDVMELDTNEYGIDSLYFNIDQIMTANMRMFSGLGDDEPAFDPDKKVTTLDIPMGTKVVVELAKTKKKNSTFRVLSMETFSDTLDADDPALFPDAIPENQIIFYFGHSKLIDHVSTNLIFKGNLAEKVLYFDTYIKLSNLNSDFQSTSNSGIYSGVRMNEMWNDDIETIRLSNIRSKE